MDNRAEELLAFDLALIDAIAQARRPLDPDDADAWPPGALRTAVSGGLVGFDEAGRGALAGPVAVGCVRIDLGRGAGERARWASALAGLDDSKRLSPRRREALYASITSLAAWGFGCASAAEIDRSGIVHACRLAARRAYAKLDGADAVGLFDRGLSLPDGDGGGLLRKISLTRGDARSLHIAAASVVAKVGRDALLDCLGRRFPGYGLSRHKGYGTVAHRDAISRLGPSVVHRRSFLRGLERADTLSC